MNYRTLAAIAFLSVVGACSEPTPEPEEPVNYVSAITPPPTQTLTPEPTSFLPPPRLHNYDEERDRTYSYIAAISEEDRKLGKAAGSVSNFRYLGRNADGEHVLASVTDAGGVKYYSRCPDRCVVIRYNYGDGTAYNPASIIGAAFQDAIRGRLKQWAPPAPPPAVMYFDEEETESEPAEPTSAPLPEMPPAEQLLPPVGEQPAPI